ncbi:PREDICTED: EP300-interacting inhibitor of differentiation 3-like isoform X2 [Dinoponera quadriceps]|uniref:Non-structural maintenance of chromosomes element 4 n=1 Tax=Dinoponera quadriceps TaxID=609295 RepID=A0A6P3WNH3_DINQU|nr:PREDICTED: EP300-interacting inhibitor of differentiation 3-like isoform X2 [Dinoponera quadriceps]
MLGYEKEICKIQEFKNFVMPRIRSNSSNLAIMRSSKERKDCLRRILEQTFILHDAINTTTIKKLDEAIVEADNVTYETSVQDKICNQQEVLIDSQMMISSSKVIKTCAVSLKKRMRDYDHIDFAQKIIKYIQKEAQDDEQAMNWSLLETQITKLFRRIPDYNTLSGTLEPLEKKVVSRKKIERKEAQKATMIVPNKLVSQKDNKEEDSVEQTIQKIRKLIISYCKETQRPLDLFKLILHPYDFGRTIRNLLYVSFLIKDGVVKLSKGERENLVVQPYRKAASQQDEQTTDKTGAQTIVSLNMKQWNTLFF